MRRTLAFVVATCIGASAAAQTPKLVPYIETFEVHIHNLDLIVTNQRGQTVPGLSKGDFLLFDAGEPQQIKNFAEYAESTGTAALPGNASSPTAAAAAATARPSRIFVFYMDEMSLHPQTQRRLMNDAVGLLEKSMSAGDRAMIVAPAADEKVVLAPTDDRRVVIRKLQEVVTSSSFRANTEYGLEVFFMETNVARASSAEERRQLMRIYAGRVRKRVEQRLGQLRSAVAALREYPGKKVVLLVTNNLAAVPGLLDPLVNNDPAGGALESGPPEGADRESRTSFFVPVEGLDWFDLRPLIRDIGRTAAASGATIYGLLPDLPMNLVSTGGPDAETGGRSALLPGASRAHSMAMDPATRTMWGEIDNTGMTLAALASETGGKWYRGGQIDAAFREIATDLQAYYSLGYTPVNANEKARKVEVKIRNHPEYTVRTRANVMERSTADELTELTVASLYYPRPVNELGIRADVGTISRDSQTATIPVLIRVPMKSLTFLHEGDVYRGSFRVHFAAAGAHRDFTAGEEREQVIEIPAERLADARTKDFSYETRLAVTSGGRYRIAVGVMDSASRLTGFQTVIVETDVARSGSSSR